MALFSAFSSSPESFGADVDVVDTDTDADLTDLEAEFDQVPELADAYGADPQARGDDAAVVADENASLSPLERSFRPDLLDNEWVDWVKGYIPDILEADIFKECRDLGTQLSRTQSFAAWLQDSSSLSRGQKGQVVNEAILMAAFPGNYPDAPAVIARAIQDAWSQTGVWNMIKTGGTGMLDALKTAFMDDFWPNMTSMSPFSDEQFINTLAIAYYVGHVYAEQIKRAGKAAGYVSESGKALLFSVAGYFDKYDEIIDAIDAAIAQGTLTTSEAFTPAPVPEPYPESYPMESVAPPSSGLALPRPQTILALGYAFLGAGAAIKALR